MDALARTRRRLPAYARQLKAALDDGLRPLTGGGGIVVTSEWHYASAFDPGRVVCPATDSPDDFDFSFLTGCDVVVLVPERDEAHGRALAARIREAGAALTYLAVNREVDAC